MLRGPRRLPARIGRRAARARRTPTPPTAGGRCSSSTSSRTRRRQGPPVARGDRTARRRWGSTLPARPGDREFPLALISPATERTISSTLGELSRPEVPLEMHPADAGRAGIDDGDEVRVFNELGEVRCGVRVTPLVRPGTVAFPKGVWRRNTGTAPPPTPWCPTRSPTWAAARASTTRACRVAAPDASRRRGLGGPRGST